MIRDSATDTLPSTSDVAGSATLSVPWDRADDTRARLAREGHPATLCLDAEARTARLELWPGADPTAAVAALGKILAADGV